VKKTATLLGVARAIVSKAMSAYTIHGDKILTKRNREQESTSTEKDGWRKLRPRSNCTVNYRSVLSSERALQNYKPATV
jgi:predicted transcriptional regulator